MSELNGVSAALFDHADRPYLRRVRIQNYRSIGKCDLELGALTVLVGRNASGKSNFLDALRFVVDGLRTTLDHAIKSRGGLRAVRRRSTGHPRNFAIELQLDLASHMVATYGFEIAARSEGAFVVKAERLEVQQTDGSRVGFYDVADGELVSASRREVPPVAADRLYLVTAASLPEFRPTYDALLGMGFYNLNPDKMKELRSPDAGDILHRDGDNLPSVLARISADQPELLARIMQYLSQIVPGIAEVERVALGPAETLQFRQKVQGAAHPWTFYAGNMSDGTLRALGALVAVTQLSNRVPVMLIGIEEPETALHPAATGALMDALREAACHTQIIVTSHSPELLDNVDPDRDVLLIVASNAGTTEVAPPDEASQQAIKAHLYSAGELLRMDQMGPDERSLISQRQLRLFDIQEDEA